MTDVTVTKTRFRNGVWEGIVEGSAETGEAPAIRVTYLDQPLDAVEITPNGDDGAWLLKIPVPQKAIADGVHTFLIRDAGTDQKLADFTMIAGEAATDDMRAEIALLRAELDMLKRAFRRHCVETTT